MITYPPHWPQTLILVWRKNTLFPKKTYIGNSLGKGITTREKKRNARYVWTHPNSQNVLTNSPSWYRKRKTWCANQHKWYANKKWLETLKLMKVEKGQIQISILESMRNWLSMQGTKSTTRIFQIPDQIMQLKDAQMDRRKK